MHFKANCPRNFKMAMKLKGTDHDFFLSETPMNHFRGTEKYI